MVQVEITNVRVSEADDKAMVYDVTILDGARREPLTQSGVDESGLYLTRHEAKQALERVMHRLLSDLA